MSQQKLTIGQAIDQVTAALAPFEEHEQNTVLTTVCALLKIPRQGLESTNAVATVDDGKMNSATDRPEANANEYPSAKVAQVDIKSLRKQKEPASAREMACLVAYYLLETEGRETINKADIEKYFKQAGFKLPTALEQVLPDSKKSGYFESVSRGEYKLSRVGYNQVVHNMGNQE